MAAFSHRTRKFENRRFGTASTYRSANGSSEFDTVEFLDAKFQEATKFHSTEFHSTDCCSQSVQSSTSSSIDNECDIQRTGQHGEFLPACASSRMAAHLEPFDALSE